MHSPLGRSVKNTSVAIPTTRKMGEVYIGTSIYGLPNEVSSVSFGSESDSSKLGIRIGILVIPCPGRAHIQG